MHPIYQYILTIMISKLVSHCVGGDGGFSKVVATFNHVDGSFNLIMPTTGGVWIIPSFWIWGYVLHVEHISCVITNCGQHQWAIPSPLVALEALLEENITRKLLLLPLDLFFKILLFQVTLFSIAIFSSGWFVIAGCGCISVRELMKYLELL